MRIEHQGYLEVQPAYQHVGYCSAALSNAYGRVGANASLGITVFLLLSLTMALRLRNRAGYVAAGVILVLGVGAYAAWGTVTIREAAKAQAWIDMVEVLQRLEVACMSVEQWDAKKNGPLTPETWERRVGQGRGRDVELRLLDEPGADG
ncbi:MAG: hypothetical protein FJX74_17245, partial [Armatimonadetes bacterium]|nr:hypothetical protein [Armatimonadota bacterium]